MAAIVTERTLWVRFYFEAEPDKFADYHAICTIVRLDHARAMIVGLNGKLSWDDMKELIIALNKLGFKQLLAQRAPGRRMPFSTQLPEDHVLANWWQLDISAAFTRICRNRSNHLPNHSLAHGCDRDRP